jgi:hypothetical protein
MGATLTELSPEVGFLVFYEDVCNPRSFDLSSGLRLPPSIQYHSLLYVAPQITYCYVRRKLPLTHWLSLEIHVY